MKINKNAKVSKRTIAAIIALDIETFLGDTSKINSVRNVLSKKTKLTEKHFDKIRNIIGIDKVKVGGFYPRARLAIDLGLKVDVVRTVKSLGASDADLLAIFGISSTVLQKILNNPATNIALAVRQYFLLRKGRVTDVRKAIKDNLGIKVKKGADYTGDEMKKLFNVFVTRLNISPKQSEKIFHSDIFGLDLGGNLTKNLSEKKTIRPSNKQPKLTPKVQKLIESYLPELYKHDNTCSNDYLSLIYSIKNEFANSDIGPLPQLKLYSNGDGLRARYDFIRAIFSFRPKETKVDTYKIKHALGMLMEYPPLIMHNVATNQTIFILESFVGIEEEDSYCALPLNKESRLNLITQYLGLNPNATNLTFLEKAKAKIYFKELLNIDDELIESFYGKDCQVLKNINF